MDASVVINKIIEKGYTFGSAESLTGGLFASTVTSVSGVSKAYKGSVISYSTLIKESVLGISHDLVEKFGVISYECAYEMAKNVAKVLDVDIAVSFTGNAGPSSMEGKEKGLVYIGINYLGNIEVREYHLDGNRDEIRNKCVLEALNLIFEKIN